MLPRACMHMLVCTRCLHIVNKACVRLYLHAKHLRNVDHARNPDARQRRARAAATVYYGARFPTPEEKHAHQRLPLSACRNIEPEHWRQRARARANLTARVHSGFIHTDRALLHDPLKNDDAVQKLASHRALLPHRAPLGPHVCTRALFTVPKRRSGSRRAATMPCKHKAHAKPCSRIARQVSCGMARENLPCSCCTMSQWRNPCAKAAS